MGVFRFLVREAQAQFTYQPDPDGGMIVTWRYTLFAHNRAARLLLEPMVAIFWRGFMSGALRRARQLAQAEWLAQAPGYPG